MTRLTFVLVAALALAGCDAKPSTSAGPAKKKYRFALIPKSLNNPVFNYGKTGAEATAKEIAAKENCEIEILWQAPANPDAGQQADLVKSFADQKIGGISVSVEQETTLTKAIDYAVGLGAHVVTFDSDAPKSKRQAFYGTEDVECGARLARYCGKLVKKGKVIIQTGSDAPNLANRVKGAQDCFAKEFPEIQVANILKCDDQQPLAIKQLADATSAYPDVVGYVLVGGWAVFGDRGLETIDPAKHVVVSCDALPKAWQYLENGKCKMLLAQDLWGWGEQSVRLLKDLADGKPVKAGPDGRINGKLEEVTKDNLEAFRKDWKARFEK